MAKMMDALMGKGDILDKIYVNQMEFYGYHGVFPEENKLGQRFIVDLIVQTDLKKREKQMTLEYSVNYGEYIRCVKRLSKENHTS